MTVSPYLIGFIVLVATGIFIYVFIIWRRHQKDYREHLEPILNAHGFKFVTAKWPGFFKVGPFLSFEVEKGRVQSRIFGFRGEFSEYRIVKFQDPKGQLYEIWANIEFELFRFRRVRWRAYNTQDLPENTKAMLEN